MARGFGRLMARAEALYDDCVAWYSDATTRFREGTPQGDLVRSTVPTTTSPTDAVGQAVISHVMVTGGTIHFDCAASHATQFTYLHKAPGSMQFVVLLADTAETSVTLQGQPNGEHRFKAIGSNSQGTGPESDETVSSHLRRRRRREWSLPHSKAGCWQSTRQTKHPACDSSQTGRGDED